MRIEILKSWGENWSQKTPAIVFLNAEILTLFLDYFNASIIQNKKETISSSSYFSSSMFHPDSCLKINNNSGNIGAILREFYLGIGQIPDLLPTDDSDHLCNLPLPSDAKIEIPKQIIDKLQSFGAVIQLAHNILIQGNTFLLKDLWGLVLGYLTSNDHIEMVTTLDESKISFFTSSNNKSKEKSESNFLQSFKI